MKNNISSENLLRIHKQLVISNVPFDCHFLHVCLVFLCCLVSAWKNIWKCMFLHSYIVFVRVFVNKISRQRYKQILYDPADRQKSKYICFLFCFLEFFRVWDRKGSIHLDRLGSSDPHMTRILFFRFCFLDDSGERLRWQGPQQGHWWGRAQVYKHGLINYKDTETKCRLFWCV